MKKNYVQIVLAITTLCMLAGCNMIYRNVRDKRDRSYREGVEFYKQNKIEQAHDRFETVVDIEPEYRDAKDYLSKTTRLLKLKESRLKQKANVNYERGVTLMNRGQYENALDLFILVQQQNPEHVEVEDKIGECRTKLAPKLEKYIANAERQYNKRQYIPAYQIILKANVLNPANSQASSLKSKIESALAQTSERYHSKGRTLYNKKQYQAAKQELQLALKANPWDKDSKELLDKCNGKLYLDKYYQNAITLFNQSNFFGAKSAFSQVNSIESGYKATEQYLTRINTILNNQVPVFYNSGVAYYDKGNYDTAITEFNKVLSINPSHSMALEYRQRAQTKLSVQKSLGGSTE